VKAWLTGRGQNTAGKAGESLHPGRRVILPNLGVSNRIGV
jgi:hypothetical protein